MPEMTGIDFLVADAKIGYEKSAPILDLSPEPVHGVRERADEPDDPDPDADPDGPERAARGGADHRHAGSACGAPTPDRPETEFVHRATPLEPIESQKETA